MNKSNVWVKLYVQNPTVTSKYLKAIGEAYGSLGFSVNYFTDDKKIQPAKSEILVVATAMDVFKLHVNGFKHIVFWSQGVWPEESFLRHESRCRLSVCNFVEKRALLCADKVFLVSNAMLKHYENKYEIELASKSYVMACTNEEIHPEAFEVEGKYSRPVFTYAGSLVKYQCIEQMLGAFARVRSVLPDAKFLFFTEDVDEANRRVSAMGLDGVVVDSKPQDQIWKSLAQAKYGFVLREDSVINRVATPTKISSYLANGVIPIYGSCIESFSETGRDILRIEYNEDSFIEDVLSFERTDIAASDVFNQYSNYFENHLSLANRADDIRAFLGKGLLK